MRNDFLEIHITPSEDSLSVKQLLRQKLRFSAHQVSRIKYRPEGITVNGAPVWVNVVLRAGDVLRLRLDDAEENDADHAAAPSALIPSVPILYEDDFLLIADKPAGMVSHPSHGHHGDSALDILSASRGRLYLIGRLDKDTSGVLLFAKHMETAALLSRWKKADHATSGAAQPSIRKEYIARICGRIDPPEGTIDTPIGIAQEFPLKMQTDLLRGKPAATHYRTVRTGTDKNGEDYSILSVQIDHGRTHQIRVHLSSVGHPLAGDALYGQAQTMPESADRGSRFPGACLHAASVTLTHPYTGKTITVRAAEPGW